MYVFACCFVFVFFSGQSLSMITPSKDFYEHENYHGSRERFIRYPLKRCQDLSVLNDKVSSVNTNGNCIRLYSRGNCTGDSVYVLADSPGHDNLSAIGFDDTANSFSTCDLDERSLCGSRPSALIPGDPEYEFWRYVFNATYSRPILQGFLSGTENGRHADWSFVTTGGGTRPFDKTGDGYEYALMVSTMKIESGWIRNNESLATLLSLANLVIGNRETGLEPENWTSRPYVVHRAILERWRSLSEALNAAIFSEKQRQL